jgi:hypothetical protein
MPIFTSSVLKLSHSSTSPALQHLTLILEYATIIVRHDIMDPLSITANVVAVIQLSDKVIEVCKNYIRSVKSAPNDLRLILVEVGSLKCVLETLELLVSSDENADHSAVVGKLKSSDGPLHGCKHALSRLEQLVSTPTDRQPDGQRRKLVDSLANLAWPLKEGSARKLLDDISRHKATITLFLTTDTMYAEHCILEILQLSLCYLQTRDQRDQEKCQENSKQN